MTDQQWETLLAVINGEEITPLPTGFIIDSPWLPNWAGHSLMDYFTGEDVWLAANLQAVRTFPETIFLPGFWSEYGMCTEPSAFGAVCVWGENEFPTAKRVIRRAADIDELEMPNPETDGLLPLVVKRLRRLQGEIEKAGHKIRFATARGPLNIASFLMGTTEFLIALKLEAEKMHQLLAMITDFLVDWIRLQRECFPRIDGLLVLDDIVGFIGEEDFRVFGLPYLKKLYATDVSVKFFHNDAPARASAPYLAEIGINLFNFGVQHTLAEMRGWTGHAVTLLGNLPPRDVLAGGTVEEVERETTKMLEALSDRKRIIPSCGGGMPPGVTTENIRTFIAAVQRHTLGNWSSTN